MTRIRLKKRWLLVLLPLFAFVFVLHAQDELGETVMVAMPDGVELATTIYLPEGEGQWGTLLMRTPYDRTTSAEFAPNLTALGIAVVVQDTRGRFESEGEHDGFFHDRVDGQATLEWVADQSWSNGRIATYGGSALAIAQYLMAAGASDALVCQWAEVGTPNFYHEAVYQGGAFRQDLTDFVFDTFADDDLRREWQANYLNDEYWDAVDMPDYSQIHAAAIHAGGWYDIFARGTIDAFLGYQLEGGEGAAGQQHLIMGAWTHGINANIPTGELTFPDAVLDDYYERWLILWLQACLIDGDVSLLSEMPAVIYYTMGAVGEEGAPGNEWRTADTWMPEGVIDVPLYLAADNGFSLEAPTDNEAGDTYTADPENPTPTLGGGNLSLESGTFDQSSIEERDDVLVYSTPPLDEPLEVTGDLRAEIWITTDVPDTDVVVRLTDVYPDGRSMLIADGILRARFRNSPDFTSEEFLEPNIPALLTIDLGPTSIIFNTGHRLRISITGTNAPRFTPNPNTGAMFLADGESGQTATVTILRDAEHPSAIVLPYRDND